MKKLNYIKMLQDINLLVDSDWSHETELKLMPHSKPYTQKEARDMAECIARVYSISHCISCKACQIKYVLK